MNKTKIEYLTHTWNPLAMRCTPISDGCKNCWHLRYRIRFPHSGEPIHRSLKELNAPLNEDKPAIIGVQFMGDLFHENVKEYSLDKIFDRICAEECNHHKFIILTKRPARMKSYFETFSFAGKENIWLGVSVEDQKTSDIRIPILLQIPGNKFVSVEPMLKEIDLTLWFLTSNFIESKIKWVICGAETGSGARYFNPKWVRSLRNQCKTAGVPFFFKSAGKGIEIPEDLKIREYPSTLKAEGKE